MKRRPSVFEMVHQVIADSQEQLSKMAAAGEGKVESEEKKDEAEEGEDKAKKKAAAFSGHLKVAEQCEFLADNLHLVEDQRTPAEKLAEHIAIQQALLKSAEDLATAPLTTGVAPGGSNSAMLAMANMTPGENPAEAGQSGQATPANQGEKVTKPGEHNYPTDAGNLMPTNLGMMAGEQPVEVLKQSSDAQALAILQHFAAKGYVDPEKLAFSVTEEGHEYDAARNRAIADAYHKMRKAREGYGEEHPGLYGLHAVLGTSSANPLMNLGELMAERHADYAARKHEGGSNAYNPFGGMLTKSRMEQKEKKAFSVTEAGHKYDAARNLAIAEANAKSRKARKEYGEKRPGMAGLHTALGTSTTSHLQNFPELMAERHADYAARKHETGNNALNPFGGLLTKSRFEQKEKKSSAQVPQRFAKVLLDKFAADAENPAHISAGTTPVLQSIAGEPDVVSQGSETGELTPRQFAPTSGQGDGRQYLGSNEAATNYTKGEAKRPQKRALGEVVTEPALSAAHDRVLAQSLDNTSSAGVKISAARNVLKKVASTSPANRKKLDEMIKAAIAGEPIPAPGAELGGAAHALAAAPPPVSDAALSAAAEGVTTDQLATAQQMLAAHASQMADAAASSAAAAPTGQEEGTPAPAGGPAMM